MLSSGSGGIAREPEEARRGASRHRVADGQPAASARVRAALDERARRGTMTEMQGRPFFNSRRYGGIGKRNAQASAMRKAGMVRPVRDERIANLKERGPASLAGRRTDVVGFKRNSAHGLVPEQHRPKCDSVEDGG